MKRALLPFAALLTAAALAACSADGSSTATPQPADTVSTTPSSTPSPTPAVDAGSPLDGTWHAGPFPLSRVSRALETAGMEMWFATVDVFPTKDPDAQVVYDLKIQGGGLLMAVTVDDAPLGVIDRQAVEVEDRQVRFIATDCPATFRWTATGDRLTLELMKDTCPDVDGTPDAAYQTALYASVPFERA